jgi:hypothetical protein
MRKILLYCFLSLFIFLSDTAKAQWTPLNGPGLTAIQIFNHKGIFHAATTYGIFRSSDEGKIWQRKSLNWAIEQIWADGDTLYAKINDRAYYKDTELSIDSKERSCFLKSTDNGINWLPIKVSPRGALLNLAFNNATVIKGKTYIAGRYISNYRRDSAGLLMRTCDNCAWNRIPGLFQRPEDAENSSEEMILVKDRIFVQQGFTQNNYISLFRLENDSLIKSLDFIIEFKNFIEKSDTFFLTAKTTDNMVKKLISTNYGRTWTAIPSKYKLPTFDDYIHLTKVGDTYYGDNSNIGEIQSKDLIRWDTLPQFFSGTNRVVYNENGVVFRSGGNGFLRRDNNGEWYSDNSGFGLHYFNLARAIDYNPLDRTIKSAIDASLAINLIPNQTTVYKSQNGGITWQMRDSMGFLYRSYKIKNKYYFFADWNKKVYELKDNTQFKWAIVDSFTTNRDFIRVWNDTLFSTRINTGDLYFEYSVNLGKTWTRMNTIPIVQDANYVWDIYHSGNFTYIILSDKIYYSSNYKDWRLLQRPKINTFDNPTYNYFDRTTHIEDNAIYYIGSVKLSLISDFKKQLIRIEPYGTNVKVVTQQPIFDNKNIETYLTVKNKIFVVVSEELKTLKKKSFEVYQSDTSGNNWFKIFESPNYRGISDISNHNDTLFLTMYPASNFYDTTASIYKRSLANITIPSNIGSDIEISHNLTISPNPTAHLINIEIIDDTFTKGTLSIYDIAGRLVMTKKVFNAKETFNVGHLGNGEYICVVMTKDNQIYAHKFLKL